MVSINSDPKMVIISLKNVQAGCGSILRCSGGSGKQIPVSSRLVWATSLSQKKKDSIFVLKIKRDNLYFKILNNVYMKEYRKIHKFSYIAY